MTTNTGLLFVLSLVTHSRALYLGMALARLIAASIIPDLYSRSNNIYFNSINLCSLLSGSEQILLIRMANENGMFSIQ